MTKLIVVPFKPKMNVEQHQKSKEIHCGEKFLYFTDRNRTKGPHETEF